MLDLSSEIGTEDQLELSICLKMQAIITILGYSAQKRVQRVLAIYQEKPAHVEFGTAY